MQIPALSKPVHQGDSLDTLIHNKITLHVYFCTNLTSSGFKLSTISWNWAAGILQGKL